MVKIPKDYLKRQSNIITDQHEDKINKLLLRLSIALGDVMHMYAPEFCNRKELEETGKRICKAGGTLAYCAELRGEIEDVT